MDPSTRRSVWKLLKQKRAGRVVMLTTHFMDEADILADRKAIISKGQLKCVGSSLFLKNKFGIGYHLGLVVEAGTSHEAVTRLVTEHIPMAALHRVHVQELVYTLPLQEATNFPGLFGAIEGAICANDANFGLVNYGVSMTTLEEVFLKIGEDEETVHEEAPDHRDLTRYAAVSTSPSHAPATAQTPDTSTPHSHAGNLGQIPNYQMDSDDLSWRQFKALVKIRFLDSLRNPAVLFFRFVFPVIFILAAVVIDFTVAGIMTTTDRTSPEKLLIDASMYANVLPNVQTPAYPNATWQVNGSGGSDVGDFMSAMEATGIVLTSLPTATNLSNVALHNLGTVVQDISSMTAAVTVLYNDSATHSLPAALNLLANTLRIMSEPNSDPIFVSSQPWPSSEPVQTFDQLSTVLLGIALVVTPSGFAIHLVLDRETRTRTQLRVAGLSMVTYWGACAVTDLAQLCFTVIMSLVIFLAFQTAWLLHGGAVLVALLMLLLFMPVNTLVSYCASFGFSTRASVQSVLPNIVFFVGMLPYFAVAVIDVFDADAATIIHYVFCLIDPPYAVIGGIHYITKVHNVAVQEIGPNPSIPVSKYFAPESNLLPVLIFPLVHIVVFYVLLRALEVRSSGGDCLQACSCDQASNTISSIPDGKVEVDEDEDEDVAAERERVNNLSSSDTVALVRNLHKEFPKNTRKACQCTAPRDEVTRVAVKNTTFGVSEGEVFGLLGPNGAGKSTTLNTMIAEVTPTAGSVFVDKYNIHSNLTEAYKRIGYCPQEDSIWAFITLQEHLEMYATCRGIRKEDIDPLVQYYMKALEVEEHAGKRAVTLSGGTKRKLSFLISLLGRPRVVLMDEPSTGMDPKSKRFLWDTISSGFHGTDKAAILTTHYMDEADALCTRVGIMVNGRLEALGSTQHLKNKYGSGYVLEVKLTVADSENTTADRLVALQRFVTELLPSATMLETFGERLTYKVPQDDIRAISKIFSSLEAEKHTFGIEEYSFSQSTLEQVFLELTRHQKDSNDGSEETTNPVSRLLSVSPSHDSNPLENTTF